MPSIPSQMQGSVALQFIQSQGWDWKVTDDIRIALGKCPYKECGKEFHCYMEIHGENDEQKNRDGLYLCQRCGKSGNLYALKQYLGLVIPGVSSQKEWGNAEKKVDPLPDTEACHAALIADEAALDYLCNIRGFSLDIIQKQKLGLTKHYFKATGNDTRALVYPYLVNGNTVWAHFRTLPDPNDLKKVPKDFASPKGWDSTLYNGEVLKDGLKDIVLVEGEANCIAAMDHGIDNICGVPGANIKKAEWIETLDKLGLEKIYVLYDADKVGQRAAQTLASRIGIEKCWKVQLPSFEVTAEDGTVRKGKDLNEWFVSGGGTPELFEALKAEATLFDVDGVSSATDALDEFTEELDNKGAGQKYIWPLISELIQFDDGDTIDILAEEKVGKTKFGMNLIEYMVDAYGDDGIIICAEMTRAKLARAWVSHKAGIPDNLPKTPEEAIQLTQAFKAAIPGVKEMAANREGTLYLCYPKFTAMDDIYKLMVDCIRRYGVKWVMLDNLQRFCDLTKGTRNRTEWLSEISKRTSQIGKDYNVNLIRILQPHRVGDNNLTTVSSVDGASQIAKDCDGMLILNRLRIGGIDKNTLQSGAFVESNVTFAPETLVTAALSRYSAGGETQIWFDGATSTFSKLSEGKVKAMLANTGNGILKGASEPAPETKPAPTTAVPEDGEITI
jgi:5S rRNA maturation endonuclease (ribonuclease M5)